MRGTFSPRLVKTSHKFVTHQNLRSLYFSSDPQNLGCTLQMRWLEGREKKSWAATGGFSYSSASFRPCILLYDRIGGFMDEGLFISQAASLLLYLSGEQKNEYSLKVSLIIHGSQHVRGTLCWCYCWILLGAVTNQWGNEAVGFSQGQRYILLGCPSTQGNLCS